MSKLIAIVDDEVEMEEIYSLLLEDIMDNHGVTMRFFSDPRLFDLWLRYNQPDLILTDINMPFLTGKELGRRIVGSGKQSCVYFVSGDLALDHELIMKELGINRFLEKPFDLNEILEFIKTDLHLQG